MSEELDLIQEIDDKAFEWCKKITAMMIDVEGHVYCFTLLKLLAAAKRTDPIIWNRCEKIHGLLQKARDSKEN